MKVVPAGQLVQEQGPTKVLLTIHPSFKVAQVSTLAAFSPPTAVVHLPSAVGFVPDGQNWQQPAWPCWEQREVLGVGKVCVGISLHPTVAGNPGAGVGSVQVPLPELSGRYPKEAASHEVQLILVGHA